MRDILEQYSEKINDPFSFFDRMIITGWLIPFPNAQGRTTALYYPGIPLKDYKEKTMEITNSIRNVIEQSAKELERPISPS